jgi:hypothetical protein
MHWAQQRNSMDTAQAQTRQVLAAQDTRVVQKMTAHLQWQKRGAKVTHEVIVYQTKAN